MENIVYLCTVVTPKKYNSTQINMKYVIVGGVAGGATAAARIRRISEQSEIILFEKGNYISYANCGLPYYIGGTIKERKKLFVQAPKAFGQRFNIDVRTQSEVIKIDPEAKKVTVKDTNGDTYEEKYDKLLLSPGASPVRPPLPGIDCNGIFTLRNVEDTDTIKDFLQQSKPKNAVIIGAGFIGLEMAENLHNAGLEVAVVEMDGQVMAPIDYSMASFVHTHLVHKGIQLYLNTAVASFNKTSDGINVILDSGESILTDMVILSIGVRPNTSLAIDANLQLGEMKGIKVNEYMQTSDDNIYAVGDVIEYPHPLTGKPWLNYLAGPANRQARIVADNMVFGNKMKYEGSIGTSIAKVFDMTVASCGLPAKRLKQFGIEYRTVTIHPNSHAGYYPDALSMSIKIIFAPSDGKLYGAQIVGYDGVDKRIDELALIIKKGGTIYDLQYVEHAYAPPYSSAKDPVAIAGYVAGNILNDKMTPLYWRELHDADLSKITLIDVRTPEEFALGALKGAINIPVDNLRNRMSEIPIDKPIYIYCGVGLRGYLASNILRQNGFTNVKNLIGGFKLYKSATAALPHPKEFAKCDKCITSVKEDMQQSIKVDACGIPCPGPVLQLKNNMERLSNGERLEIIATDAGFPRDAEAWCNTTGNRFISYDSQNGKHTVVVEKGNNISIQSATEINSNKGKTSILKNSDYQK